MRSFLPALRVAPSRCEPTLRAKFGGLPWGLPSRRWPLCRECGEAMSCLAQIPVRGHLDQAGPFAGRGDLSDQVLHLFLCERPSICSFWEPDSGANVAFFLARDALRAPGPASNVPAAPVLPEVWIEGWMTHDDPVPDEMAASFTDSGLFYALPDAMQFPTRSTRPCRPSSAASPTGPATGRWIRRGRRSGS